LPEIIPATQSNTSPAIPGGAKKKGALSAEIKLPFEFGVGKDRDYFLSNLTMLLSAGLNLLMALEIVKAGLKTNKMKESIAKMKAEIEAGSSFWRALSKTDLFKEREITLIKIGEESGKLTDNLKMVVEQQEKSKALTRKVRSALTYPTIVLTVGTIVGVGVSWLVLPKLTDVLLSLNVELPFTTRVVIFIGEYLKANGHIAVPIFFVLLTAIVYIVFINKKTNFIGEKFLLHMPVINMLIKNVEIARFGYTLSTLLDSGVNFLNSLQSVKDSTSIRAYKNFYDRLKTRVELGESIDTIMKTEDPDGFLFPFYVQQMIAVSEHTGGLTTTLMKIHKIHDEKVNESTENLSTLLEPILMIVIFGIVLFLGMAVLSPIYGLIGGLSEFGG
jgi:type IV pilus assembly protein PilC